MAAAPPIDLQGNIVIVGNYGTGKTEVAVNLAVYQRRLGRHVRIADLDLVNPYFRTREARRSLEAHGIEVVLPPEQYMQADLPLLSPAVAGMIKRPAQVNLLDVGGDGVGATVLAALADAFAARAPHVLLVINPLLPFNATISSCVRIKREIETASRLRVTGIVSNAHLMDETAAADIVDGFHFAQQLARETNLPLVMITAATHLLAALDLERFACPVLPVHRQMVPPWKKSVPF